MSSYQLTLRVGGMEETVEVVGGAPMLDSDSMKRVANEQQQQQQAQSYRDQANLLKQGLVGLPAAGRWAVCPGPLCGYSDDEVPDSRGTFRR